MLAHLLLELLHVPLDEPVFGSRAKPPNLLVRTADLSPQLDFAFVSLESLPGRVNMTNALLSATSFRASPFHPHPSVVRSCCGISTSVAYKVAVVTLPSFLDVVITRG